MTAIELYKFTRENKLEWHWYDEDVILFIPNYDLDDWNKLLGHGITDEDGLECVMRDGYFCFCMKDICEYFGIDINEIFEKDE